MTQATAVIDTLKHVLKSHGITYAEIARRLRMSEANIKRLFASKRFTLERLEDICHLMQMDIIDLVKIHEESRHRITRLTLEQEQALIRDPKLLFVAVSVRNQLGFEEIIANYQISKTECIRYLAKLDRLKIIDLLPGNRIKLRIDENFRWLPNGPIERFFESQIQSQFLKSDFTHAQSQRLFQFGLLSDASIQMMLNKIESLAKDFMDLHRQDAGLPLVQRHNIGLMLALRPWELGVFQPLRRQSG